MSGNKTKSAFIISLFLDTMQDYIILYGEDRLKKEHLEQTENEMAELFLYRFGIGEKPKWLDETPRIFDDEKKIEVIYDEFTKMKGKPDEHATS